MPPLPPLLSLADIAADLGINVGSARTYHKRATRNRAAGAPRPGDLPPPDATLGRTPGWTRDTYLAWKAARPGRGAGGGRPRKSTTNSEQ